MILLVDIGNSRIKWAWLQHEQLQDIAAASHRQMELDALWQQCWGSAIAPGRVVVAVVARSEIADSLTQWVKARWGLAIEFVRSSAQACGVVNGYNAPEQLGVDRWCALLGARALETGLVCVVDCGTAVTLDVLRADGVHAGGWIGAGLAMMRGELVHGTAGVRYVAESGSEHAQDFGCTTAEGVELGTHQMIAGMVLQALTLLERKSGHRAECIVTGGDAVKILPFLPAHCRHEPQLVLMGLALLAQDADNEALG